MQNITPNDYYKLVVYYIVMAERMKDVRESISVLSSIIKNESVTDSLFDLAYSPTCKITKEEFDEIIAKNGIVVDWNGKLKDEEK